MTNYNDTFKSLTGGGADSLDGIAVATLSDLDAAYGMVSGLYHPYTYDAASTESEDSPYVIIPNDNVSGTGAWVLGGFQGAMSHVSAKSNAGQTLVTATPTPLIFEDEDYDTLGEYVAATGIFTATYAGYYKISSGFMMDNAAWAASLALYIAFAINSTDEIEAARLTTQASATNYYSICGASTLYVTAGQTITVNGFHQQGGNLALRSSSSKYNYLTIDRLI